MNKAATSIKKQDPLLPAYDDPSRQMSEQQVSV